MILIPIHLFSTVYDSKLRFVRLIWLIVFSNCSLWLINQIYAEWLHDSDMFELFCLSVGLLFWLSVGSCVAIRSNMFYLFWSSCPMWLSVRIYFVFSETYARCGHSFENINLKLMPDEAVIRMWSVCSETTPDGAIWLNVLFIPSLNDWMTEWQLGPGDWQGNLIRATSGWLLEPLKTPSVG